MPAKLHECHNFLIHVFTRVATGCHGMSGCFLGLDEQDDTEYDGKNNGGGHERQELVIYHGYRVRLVHQTAEENQGEDEGKETWWVEESKEDG